MHRVHARLDGQRLKDGADDDDGWNGIEKAANNQENHRDKNARARDAEIPCTYARKNDLGNLVIRQQPAKCAGGAHTKQRDTR